jgi:hypothetical protein
MRAPMAVHVVAVVALGVVPRLGVHVVSSAAALFGGRFDVRVVDAVLAPLQTATIALAVVLGATCALGFWLGRDARRHVTWGCGYTAPNARMQYTASSFSAQLARMFEGLLPQLRREKLPTEVFPAAPGHLATQQVDAVERRMFEVLGQGEAMVTGTSKRISEEPRFAFAAGLVALVIVVALLLRGGP